MGRPVRDPNILTAPAGRAALVRGMGQMARLLRPTLGPIGRTVAIAPLVTTRPPEILDSGATIARRIVGIGDPFEEMGAMIVRHLVWRVHEQVGDGAATAAVLTQSLVEQAHTYLTAGGSAVAVKRGIERGLEAAEVALRRQSRQIDEPDEIAGLIAGNVRQPELSAAIAAIVDAVGSDGSIQIEDATGRETTWEYLEGIRWSEGYLSPHFLRDGETTARLLAPRIFMTTHHIERAEQLLPVLEACAAAGARCLLVIAPAVRDAAIGLLTVNRERGSLDQAIAVKAPLFGDQRAEVLDDLAIVTGGRCFREDRYDSLDRVTIDDLGQARQAWATHSHFGVLGGRGDRAALRARIVDVKHQLRRTPQEDGWVRERLRERIGKLSGTAAILRVGAATPSAQAELKARIESAIATGRAAVSDGVVPGGGAALRASAAEVVGLDLEGDEAAGARMLARALGMPMRVLAENAGHAAAAVLHEADRRGGTWTYDVVHGTWVEAFDAGLVDALPVVLAALRASVSAAGVALTSDVLIHRPGQSASVQP